MFLRENAMIPMLQTAPKHISDDNFEKLELVINIADNLDQTYYDDGVEGHIHAALKDGILEIALKDIPAEKFRIYTPMEVTAIIINGGRKPFYRKDTCYLTE